MAYHHMLPKRLQPDSTPTDAKTRLKKQTKQNHRANEARCYLGVRVLHSHASQVF